MKLVKLKRKINHPYGNYLKGSVFKEIDDFQYFDSDGNFIIVTGQKTSNKINSNDFEILPSLNEIEWYEESGSFGGWDGVKIDIKNKEIIWSNGRKNKLTREYQHTVKYVIEKKLKQLKERLEEVKKRLNQKKTIRQKIKNGYMFIEPLTEKKRNHFVKEKKQILDTIIFLENISINDLMP